METGLIPMKPRMIRPLKVKDWKGLITDFSMALVNGTLAVARSKTDVDAAIDAAAASLENLFSVSKDVCLEEAEEELLWKLITRAMWRAAYKLADESRNSFPMYTDAERKKLAEQIPLHIEWLMSSHELAIDEDFFIHPDQCALVAGAKDFIRDLLSSLIGLSQAESLAARLPSFFIYELHDEWRMKPDVYKPIHDYFYGSPFMRAKTEDRDWEHYRSFLYRQADEAVFGSNLGLSQLYIPLNASYAVSQSGKNMNLRSAALRENQESEREVAVDLEAYLLNNHVFTNATVNKN